MYKTWSLKKTHSLNPVPIQFERAAFRLRRPFADNKCNSMWQLFLRRKADSS